jgi:heme/copper-type cytochrome/quinol oxidase subunit 2
MTEETLTPPVQTSTEEINTTPATSTPSSPLDKEKNMLGIVALVTAIIGLLLTLSIFGSIVGIPLLILALLLGIIAVFRRPRGNATASIIIAFLPLGIFTYFAYQISTIIIEPIKDFSTWAYEQSTIPERNAVANQP